MMERDYTFEQAIYWMGQVQHLFTDVEPIPGEGIGHVQDDADQIVLMKNYLTELRAIYCPRIPVEFDQAVIAGVYQDIEAMYAEIRAEILSSIQDERDSGQIGAAIARLFKIANWHESDGDPRSLRLDAMFAPLFREDPAERTEFYKAQDTFSAHLENMMLELNEKLPSPAHA